MQRSARGFTLVEVLVALAVMAILAGLAWQAVDGMGRSRERVDAALSRDLELQTALAQWEQDLEQALSETSLPGIHYDGARLRIVRRTAAGPVVVCWWVQGGRWRRWISPVHTSETALAAQWAAVPALQGSELGSIGLGEAISGWQIFFFRGNAWTNAQSSGDLVAAGVAAAQGASAPTAVRERLPQGVRLVLAGAVGAQPVSLTRDVLVPGGQP